MKYVKKSGTLQSLIYNIDSIPGATAANVNKYHLEVVDTSTGSKTVYPGAVATGAGTESASGAYFKFSVAFLNEGAYVVSLISSDTSDLDLKSVLTTLSIDTIYAVALAGIHASGDSPISF